MEVESGEGYSDLNTGRLEPSYRQEGDHGGLRKSPSPPSSPNVAWTQSCINIMSSTISVVRAAVFKGMSVCLFACHVDPRLIYLR